MIRGSGNSQALAARQVPRGSRLARITNQFRYARPHHTPEGLVGRRMDTERLSV